MILAAFTDKSIPYFSKLRNLRELALCRTSVSERAVNEIKAALPATRLVLVSPRDDTSRRKRTLTPFSGPQKREDDRDPRYEFSF